MSAMASAAIDHSPITVTLDSGLVLSSFGAFANHAVAWNFPDSRDSGGESESRPFIEADSRASCPTGYVPIADAVTCDVVATALGHPTTPALRTASGGDNAVCFVNGAGTVKFRSVRSSLSLSRFHSMHSFLLLFLGGFCQHAERLYATLYHIHRSF